jgi:hypothetical protein
MDGWRGTKTSGRGGNIYWLVRWRTGQMKNDNEIGRGCTNGYGNPRQGCWRGFKCGGAWSAWRGSIESTHARCSTLSRPSEHARGRPKEIGQSRWRALEDLRVHGGDQWREGSSWGGVLFHKAYRWPLKAQRARERVRASRVATWGRVGVQEGSGFGADHWLRRI